MQAMQIRALFALTLLATYSFGCSSNDPAGGSPAFGGASGSSGENASGGTSSSGTSGAAAGTLGFSQAGMAGFAQGGGTGGLASGGTAGLAGTGGQLGSGLATPVQRVVEKLATGTGEVRVLVYGQSISDKNAEWWKILRDDLAQRYPNANLLMESHGRGACAASCMLGKSPWWVDSTTAARLQDDVYAWNPDLIIFHVYGGEADYEEVIKGMVDNTDAEILLQGDHVDWRPADGGPPKCDPAADPPSVAEATSRYEWHDVHNRTFLPQLATKYGLELAPVWEKWGKYLDDHDLQGEDLLSDCIHPNAAGWQVLSEIMAEHFSPRR